MSGTTRAKRTLRAFSEHFTPGRYDEAADDARYEAQARRLAAYLGAPTTTEAAANLAELEHSARWSHVRPWRVRRDATARCASGTCRRTTSTEYAVGVGPLRRGDPRAAPYCPRCAPQEVQCPRCGTTYVKLPGEGPVAANKRHEVFCLVSVFGPTSRGAGGGGSSARVAVVHGTAPRGPRAGEGEYRFLREHWEDKSRPWFEYHCWEDPKSSDAELWYRSHQRVTVTREAKHDGWPGSTMAERFGAAQHKTYEILFDDGFRGTANEDELLTDPRGFTRPAPPAPPRRR